MRPPPMSMGGCKYNPNIYEIERYIYGKML